MEELTKNLYRSRRLRSKYEVYKALDCIGELVAHGAIWNAEDQSGLNSNEWANAEQLVRDLDDDHELSCPISLRRWPMGWMKDLTDQSFDSPEKWVRWWQENRSNLVLSEDGRKLVSKRK